MNRAMLTVFPEYIKVIPARGLPGGPHSFLGQGEQEPRIFHSERGRHEWLARRETFRSRLNHVCTTQSGDEQVTCDDPNCPVEP